MAAGQEAEESAQRPENSNIRTTILPNNHLADYGPGFGERASIEQADYR